jgi:3-deoxy-manno-octulosonate cytidylyltransferase (CMP-KDO synthetase)
MLIDLGGKPLDVLTAVRARAAKTVGRVIVAADDERIFDAVTAAGFEAVMTRADHNSGSDRIAEAAEGLPAGSIIVNVQGDEPLIDPETIDRAVRAMENHPAAEAAPLLRKEGSFVPDIVTVYEELRTSEELFDPNIVKVVTNEDGMALYFSRSPVPFPRDASNRYGGLREALAAEPELYSIFKKHVGLYVYRREYLLEFTKMAPTPLEQTEMLEQLRALENGAYIKVVEAAASSIGVDTEEDLAKVREFVQKN